MTSYLIENEAETYKMAMFVLPKFLTLKWNISRTIWRIRVGNGSFFFAFFTLFHLSLTFFRPEVPSHQRTCRTIRGLNQELTDALRSHDHDNEDKITTDNLVQLDDQLRTKPGIKLPKADSGWELANLFFKSELSASDSNRDNLNETIASMNSTIYNYFADSYGTVEMYDKKDNDLFEKYGEFSVNNLKKELKKLKRSNSYLRTIK